MKKAKPKNEKKYIFLENSAIHALKSQSTRKQIRVLFTTAAMLISLQLQPRAEDLQWDLLQDSILCTAGVTYFVISELLLSKVSLQETPLTPDPQDINDFDRMAVFPYSASPDTASDILQYCALLTPCLPAAGLSPADWPKIAVLYAEAVSFALGTKNILKYFISRYRPFMYYENVPPSLLADADFMNSFPSGHTTMAFTGAAFATWLFSFYQPDSPWLLPVVVLNYGLAAATACLRIVSGNHFLSDAAAGILIGTAAGIIIPQIHLKNHRKNSGLKFNASLQNIEFRLAL